MTTERVAARAAARLDASVVRLCDYLRIPAISCEPEQIGRAHV